MLEPKVGRVMLLEGESILPVSGQPGPRSEVMVKDQEGGRVRIGEEEEEARVVVMPRRARMVVVGFMVGGDFEEGGEFVGFVVRVS